MKTQQTKTDVSLGVEIRKHLVGVGVETPMTEGYSQPDDLKSTIALHTQGTLTALGLDLTDDSLAETPTRVSKMLVDELFWGLDYNNFPKATVVQNKMQYDEMVLERNITVQSMCEHHLLPILGTAHVAYIPGDRVLGLSKLNRIVDFFCRRPQIQERLTAQVYHTLSYLLGTKNVAVCITAEHMCVKMRGVQDACSDTVTSKLGGDFRENANTRAEFFNLINVNK